MNERRSPSLVELEEDLGGQLRQLPAVKPTDALLSRLEAMELPSRTSVSPGDGANAGDGVNVGDGASVGGVNVGDALAPSGRQRQVSWRLPRLGMIAAMLLVTLCFGWGYGLWRDSAELSGLGPLLVPSAYGEGSELSFRLGADGTRLIEWTGLAEFPELPDSLSVVQLQRSRLNKAEQVLSLAESMGITETTLTESGEMVTVRGEEFRIGDGVDADQLMVDLRSGSWYFSARGGDQAETATIDAALASERAQAWLERSGLLPESCRVETLPDELGSFLVKFSLTGGPDGLPVVSQGPFVSVQVSARGEIMLASGVWYEEARTFSQPTISYQAALARLKQGDGEFDCRAFHPLAAGTATVEQVSAAYQLVYTLDFVPHLVPVAVFRGQYVSEEGNADAFVAYVSLLQHEERSNAGNYQLKAELPAPMSSVADITERENSASGDELPAIAQFFAGADSSDADYPTVTSWDGGWMWRGVWSSDQVFSGRLTEEQAIDVASALVESLPSLPGTLGEPEIMLTEDAGNGASDEYCYVIFGLQYNGISAWGADGNHHRSRVEVQVKLTDVAGHGDLGAITMVHLATPMQLSTSTRKLITPQAAWQRLLDNQATIYLADQSSPLPASYFQVPQSEINSVRLSYVPEHPEFARNEQWNLVYVFSGVAQVGERMVQFSALVDALK